MHNPSVILIEALKKIVDFDNLNGVHCIAKAALENYSKLSNQTGQMTDSEGFKMESIDGLALKEVYEKWIDEFEGFNFDSNMVLTMGLSYQIVRLGIAYAEVMSSVNRHLKENSQ